MAERTILIEQRCKISYNNRYVVIEKDSGTTELHFDEFDTIIFETLNISCSLFLLNKLSSSGKTVIICDEKMLPYSGVFPLYGTQNAYAHLKKQLSWGDARKNLIWKQIVEQKIKMQQLALNYCGIDLKLKEGVLSGDTTNVEGRFANAYFSNMYGKSFHRHDKDEVNSALNYGYVILTSSMARIIASHGYALPLGIHHISENNNFNLACDLVEPFRPIVDVIVKYHYQRALDAEYKKDLIKALYEKVCYGGKKYSVKNAMEALLIESVRLLNGESERIGEFEFCA